LFSEIFYYIPEKIGLAGGGALPNDLDEIARLSSDSADSGVRGFDIW